MKKEIRGVKTFEYQQAELPENYNQELKDKYPHIFASENFLPERLPELGIQKSIESLLRKDASENEIIEIMDAIFRITDEVNSWFKFLLKKDVVLV